jgi:hypothetical protein
MGATVATGLDDGMAVGIAVGAVGLTRGALPQPASIPTMLATHHHTGSRDMTLLLLEALGAGLILIGIIWWTMFSGRKNGELPESDDAQDTSSESNKKK